MELKNSQNIEYKLLESNCLKCLMSFIIREIQIKTTLIILSKMVNIRIKVTKMLPQM